MLAGVAYGWGIKLSTAPPRLMSAIRHGTLLLYILAGGGGGGDLVHFLLQVCSKSQFMVFAAT